MRRALLLTIMALATVPRVASADASVGVFNNSFNPTPAEAAAGETVTWTWHCNSFDYGGGSSTCRTHNVTAYQGATFASGNLNGQGLTFSYTLTSSTPIRYRCTLHSSVSGGACNGMCGAIEPDSQKPAIRIFSPASPLVAIGTPDAVIPFNGDVKDNRGLESMWLRVQPLTGGSRTEPIACPWCPDGAQRLWNSPLTLSPGYYTVTAWARDTSGLEGSSAPITIVVI